MTAERVHWPLDVLLAEDTPSDVDLYRLALARVGTPRSFNVVEDGQDMIDFLRGEFPAANGWPRPNILLLDLKMPRRDGFDVLTWLKGHPECSIIPTIMVSNSAHEGDIKGAYELGATAFFVKPTRLVDLTTMLRVIFEFWATCECPESISLCR